jgi:uncharacterized membrane protein YraQ (UPF0718 family)
MLSFSLIQDLQLLGRIAVAIFLEAAPFLLLGSLLSVVFERYVDPQGLARRIPAGRLGQTAAGLLGGMCLPICECGVVPVARRLLERRLPAQTVITYLLAAPVVNPVVLAGTYVAFGGSMRMVVARAAAVGLTAAVVGWGLGRRRPEALLRPAAAGESGLNDPGAAPGHAPECRGRTHGRPSAQAVFDLLRRAALEFMGMGRFLIVGALAAAAFKVFLPWQWIQMFGGSLILSVGLMMGLAVLLSVCSETDAFVAASFVYFPAAAQLAFIAIGPMVDLKLIGMYLAAFRRRVALALIVIPIIGVYALSLLASIFLR